VPDRFATVLTCIDGRIQRPVQDWARNHLAVDYLDVVTEPGPDSVVDTTSEPALAALLRKVKVSQRAHGSATLLVAGHSDCAGNPATDDEHQRQLHRAADRLARNLPGTRIIAVHAAQCGHDCWQIRVVAEIAA
jgi:carbonic anhydrase